MNSRPSQARHVAIAALLLIAACGDDLPRTADDSSAASTTAQVSPSAGSGLADLPTRDGPRGETTGGVPHVQINAEPVPEVDADLRRRVYRIPGIEERESQLSLPGARSLWLAEDLELARPEVLQVGREFGHFHPDGSLHLWLPVERATEVAETKWGELHPWVDRDTFWDGVVMIYIPETPDEAAVALQLVVDAYNHITGADLDPADFE